jgi:hypothetical protein
MAEGMFLNQKVIGEVESRGEVTPLDDMYLIEDVAMHIQELSKKVEFCKGYKKKKRLDIDAEIKSLENKIKFFKKVIFETLKENKEKNLSFPGSCKVSRRKPRDKWVIKDEEALIEILKSEEEIDNVTELITSYKITKKKLDTLLEGWTKSGKIEGVSTDCVDKEVGEDTVSIAYLNEDAEDDVEDNASKEEIPVKGENYDSLEF